MNGTILSLMVLKLFNCAKSICMLQSDFELLVGFKLQVKNL